MPLDFSEILVTGGAGFIGSHIVDRLLDEELSQSPRQSFYGITKESSSTQKQKIVPVHRRRHQKL